MRYRTALHNFKLYSNHYPFKGNLYQHPKFSSNSPKIMSTSSEVLEQSRRILKDMFSAGIKAVSPIQIIKDKVHFDNGTLYIDDKTFQVQDVYLVGFGKAVMSMALALEQILGDSLKKGIISVPAVSKDALWESDMSLFPKLSSRVIEFCEGSFNNQPDERSLETTHKILDMIEPLTENDTIIALISGGGSALLYMPRPVIDQDDKMDLCRTLQNAGADIKELNTVRQKLSLVKGGGLARMAYPAQVISLILSDIVGDPIDLIASGPTVYCAKPPDKVVEILRKYNLFGKVHTDIKTVMTSKELFDDKPLLNAAKEFKHVHNIIIGNNEIAINAAVAEALKQKVTPIVLRNDVVGNVRDVSLAYVHIVSLILLSLEKVMEREEFLQRIYNIPLLSLSPNKVDEICDVMDNINGEGIVLIAGGEPTVVVTGSGKGGRNQELALYFSMNWLLKIKDHPKFSEYDVIMLSAGTDGQDGPTDAAGAFGYAAIGPEVYDLYQQIRSKTTQELARADAEKEASQRVVEKPKEVCKMQMLSGYATARTTSSEELIKSLEQKQEASPEPEPADDIEDIHPLELQTMEVERMLPENVLTENDSYNFYSRFKKGADMLKTGVTGTNVMDLHFIYIKRRNCSCKVNFTEDSLTENLLGSHDLYIDPSTLSKYKMIRKRTQLVWERHREKEPYAITDKADQFNIKIIDDNLLEPCCRKERKCPPKTVLKKKHTEFYNKLLPE